MGMESHWNKEKCPGEGQRAGNLLQGLQVPSQRQLQCALSFGWESTSELASACITWKLWWCTQSSCVFSVWMVFLAYRQNEESQRTGEPRASRQDLTWMHVAAACAATAAPETLVVQQARQALQSYKNFWASPVDQHALFYLSLCERQALKQIIYWHLIFDILPVCSAR